MWQEGRWLKSGGKSLIARLKGVGVPAFLAAIWYGCVSIQPEFVAVLVSSPHISLTTRCIKDNNPFNMRLIRGVMLAALIIGLFPATVFSSPEAGGGAGAYSKEDIEKMEQAIKSGKTVSLGKGNQWSVSGTGTGSDSAEAILAKFEHLPGGQTAVKIARKIISMYREYLDKIEVFAKNIGL